MLKPDWDAYFRDHCCPYCGCPAEGLTRNIVGITTNNDTCEIPVECGDCGHMWAEVYRLDWYGAEDEDGTFRKDPRVEPDIDDDTLQGTGAMGG